MTGCQIESEPTFLPLLPSAPPPAAYPDSIEPGGLNCYEFDANLTIQNLYSQMVVGGGATIKNLSMRLMLMLGNTNISFRQYATFQVGSCYMAPVLMIEGANYIQSQQAQYPCFNFSLATTAAPNITTTAAPTTPQPPQSSSSAAFNKTGILAVVFVIVIIILVLGLMIPIIYLKQHKNKLEKQVAGPPLDDYNIKMGPPRHPSMPLNMVTVQQISIPAVSTADMSPEERAVILARQLSETKKIRLSAEIPANLLQANLAGLPAEDIYANAPHGVQSQFQEYANTNIVPQLVPAAAAHTTQAPQQTEYATMNE